MDRRNIIPYDEDKRNWDYAREEAYRRAKEKVRQIKGFYWHLAIYLIVNAALIILITGPGRQGFWSFGTFSTAFFWGIGLAFHYMRVFAMDGIFGKEWEKRKIQELMEKEREREL